MAGFFVRPTTTTETTDHMERLCWFCEHFRFDGGDHDYSDRTPGRDTALRCGKGRWVDSRHQYTGKPARVTADLVIETREDFRRAMVMARTCPHWEVAADLIQLVRGQK